MAQFYFSFALRAHIVKAFLILELPIEVTTTLKGGSAMAKDMKADFCIEIDFQKGSESPSRVFRAMSELIETFQAIDLELVQSIDAKIEPVALIEDIEAGSIKTWLRYMLKAIDDEALKKLDWKPAVGKYLVEAKRLIIDWTENKTEVVSREQVEELERGLLGLAEKTDVTHFPSYAPVQRQKLLPNLVRLTDALAHLNENDKAIYISADKDVRMNAQFHIVPENIEQLLTQETITTSSEMILKVKKPDYLGESQWEFRHGSHPIIAKILDIDWLRDFQNRKHDVRPGDSLRVSIDTVVRYGFDNEVVGTHYNINTVKEVIRLNPPTQLSLLPPADDKT